MLHLLVLIPPSLNGFDFVYLGPLGTRDDLGMLIQDARVMIDLRKMLILLIRDQLCKYHNSFLIHLFLIRTSHCGL